jgi:hypothetical protein
MKSNKLLFNKQALFSLKANRSGDDCNLINSSLLQAPRKETWKVTWGHKVKHKGLSGSRRNKRKHGQELWLKFTQKGTGEVVHTP